MKAIVLWFVWARAWDIPVVMRNGLLFVESSRGLVLVDSGASRSVLGRESIEHDDVVGRVATRLGSVVDPSLWKLPPLCCGIAGFDFLREACFLEGASQRSVVVDATASSLGINSKVPAGLEAVPLRADAYPLAACEVFALGSCEAVGIVDTGSPVTIASPAVDATALLFDDGDGQPLETVGVDGAATKLVPKRAAGIRIAGVERPGQRMRVGDLPSFRGLSRLGPNLVILGLDALGPRFAFEFLPKPKKKSRREGAPPAVLWIAR